ncbi:hypothetical protein [Nostoc sp.]|uniref:hypothetical protein n=1 Tax=Nostoc sp. TaxID=1180 RepID=UPI002FEF8C81
MPRKTTVPSQSIKVTPLALSQLHIRLEFLEKEHQSLLKQIKRKRTELNNFVEQMRSFGTEFLNNEDDLTRRCRTLEQHNQILLAQYEKLRQELRLTKNTPEGTMVSDSRKAAKKGIDAMAAIVETMESQINVVSEIRDFVKDFREQKITIKEFLAGPTPLHSLDEETIEDILEQMLSEFMR